MLLPLAVLFFVMSLASVLHEAVSTRQPMVFHRPLRAAHLCLVCVLVPRSGLGCPGAKARAQL